MGMAGGGNLQLGPQHQGVLELALHAHGAGRNGTAMGRDKIHQPKADALHARVGGDGKSVLHRSGRFNQHMQGRRGP